MTLLEILAYTLTDPATDQQIGKVLDQVCDDLPATIQSECHILMTEYIDEIMELLVNKFLEPKKICDTLSLCPWIVKSKIILEKNEHSQLTNFFKELRDILFPEKVNMAAFNKS